MEQILSERKKRIIFLKRSIQEVIERSKTLDYQMGDLHLLADLRGELKLLEAQHETTII